MKDSWHGRIKDSQVRNNEIKRIEVQDLNE
jgi:hypothetical protein